ncbi:MAG: TorF family putative porin [Sulfurimonas sp.]|nr:TorF family putative porin [Sulfurimonas sp.]
MKLIKLSLVAALATTVSFATDFKNDVVVSANVAMTSNYVWRGMTQTNDNMATQGGFDLDYKGAYFGAWGSNISHAEGVELDLYAGYMGKILNFSYDAGFILYAYPNAVDANNFGEVYMGAGYDFKVVSVIAMYSLGIKTNDISVEDYVEINLYAPLAKGFSLATHYGIYTNIGSDYSVGISTSLDKIDFNLSYVGFITDSDTNADDQDNAILTVSTSF